MIYVHVPFCRSFCTYCDFYSERACPTQRWLDEVCAEARARKDEIAAAAAVDTLYFGGGTPSVLPLEFIGRIADACGGRSYREWTVEVNPDDITPEYAAGLRALGVNRVSMGVQSLDDGMLRWMNRRHDSDGARRAFRQLREAGFDNVSVDVIFGVDGMDSRMLEATVRGILDWRPEHISAYQLSVEEGSALGRMSREGRYSDLPDEECSAQYYLVCRLLAEAGYEHYEISNWALPGRRAVHNSAYWTRAPYVGLGPGAHSLGLMDSRPQTRTAQTPGQAAKTAETASDVTAAAAAPAGCRSAANRRSWNSEALSGWTVSREVLSEAEIREEQIMLGLRTEDGVRAELLQGSREGLVPAAVPGCLRIPEERWFVADDIISGLI